MNADFSRAIAGLLRRQVLWVKAEHRLIPYLYRNRIVAGPRGAASSGLRTGEYQNLRVRYFGFQTLANYADSAVTVAGGSYATVSNFYTPTGFHTLEDSLFAYPPVYDTRVGWITPRQRHACHDPMFGWREDGYHEYDREHAGFEATGPKSLGTTVPYLDANGTDRQRFEEASCTLGNHSQLEFWETNWLAAQAFNRPPRLLFYENCPVSHMASTGNAYGVGQYQWRFDGQKWVLKGALGEDLSQLFDPRTDPEKLGFAVMDIAHGILLMPEGSTAYGFGMHVWGADVVDADVNAAMGFSLTHNPQPGLAGGTRIAATVYSPYWGPSTDVDGLTYEQYIFATREGFHTYLLRSRAAGQFSLPYHSLAMFIGNHGTWAALPTPRQISAVNLISGGTWVFHLASWRTADNHLVAAVRAGPYVTYVGVSSSANELDGPAAVIGNGLSYGHGRAAASDTVGLKTRPLNFGAQRPCTFQHGVSTFAEGVTSFRRPQNAGDYVVADPPVVTQGLAGLMHLSAAEATGDPWNTPYVNTDAVQVTTSDGALEEITIGHIPYSPQSVNGLFDESMSVTAPEGLREFWQPIPLSPGDSFAPWPSNTILGKAVNGCTLTISEVNGAATDGVLVPSENSGSGPIVIGVHLDIYDFAARYEIERWGYNQLTHGGYTSDGPDPFFWTYRARQFVIGEQASGLGGNWTVQNWLGTKSWLEWLCAHINSWATAQNIGLVSSSVSGAAVWAGIASTVWNSTSNPLHYQTNLVGSDLNGIKSRAFSRGNGLDSPGNGLASCPVPALLDCTIDCTSFVDGIQSGNFMYRGSSAGASGSGSHNMVINGSYITGTGSTISAAFPDDVEAVTGSANTSVSVSTTRVEAYVQFGFVNAAHSPDNANSEYWDSNPDDDWYLSYDPQSPRGEHFESTDYYINPTSDEIAHIRLTARLLIRAEMTLDGSTSVNFGEYNVSENYIPASTCLYDEKYPDGADTIHGTTDAADLTFYWPGTNWDSPHICPPCSLTGDSPFDGQTQFASYEFLFTTGETKQLLSGGSASKVISIGPCGKFIGYQLDPTLDPRNRRRVTYLSPAALRYNVQFTLKTN